MLHILTDKGPKNNDACERPGQVVEPPSGSTLKPRDLGFDPMFQVQCVGSLSAGAR